MLLIRVSQPFRGPNPAPVLQDRLPYSRLPKTLIVHDPYSTVRARHQQTTGPWTAKPDITHVYRLQLSDEGLRRLADEQKALIDRQALDEEKLARFFENPLAETRPTDRGILVVPAGAKEGPAPPAVFFMHEARSQKKEVEVAHLYLTTKQMLGRGNHSYVYNAEWEVPRSVLADYVMCKTCLYEKGMQLLKEQDGENGERRDAKWDVKSGRIIVVKRDMQGVGFETGRMESHQMQKVEKKSLRKYEGPIRVIQTGVQFQSFETGPLCAHLLSTSSTSSGTLQPSPETQDGTEDLTANPTFACPSTARVLVTAKVSLEHDDHLPREARNYQTFAPHLSTHYNGYNLMPPFLDPVPCGAVVPQFYGYYVPDDRVAPVVGERIAVAAAGGVERDLKAKKKHDFGYRSPILLVENCGNPLGDVIGTMNIDDRCARSVPSASRPNGH